MSIYKEYYSDKEFVDRFLQDPSDAMDILIPVVHTNELWRSNLLSFYREIPVNRLLIGDGGCVDNSIGIAKDFPRVEVFDHSQYISLGYSIRKLIEEVETEWFVYLHSDVYLPTGWLERMKSGREKFDWFECQRHMTILLDYLSEEHRAERPERPLSGSQMGRRSVLQSIVPLIDDDYLYRSEDIVIADLVEREGYKYGCVSNAYHYHQIMNKNSAHERKLKVASFDKITSRDEDIRACTTMARSLVKYMEPTSHWLDVVQRNIDWLHALDAFDWDDFKNWVGDTDPRWEGRLHRPSKFRQRVRAGLFLLRKIFGK